jgi:hypothetical protein
MSKKPRLNESAMQSELSESAFFRGRRAEQQQASQDEISRVDDQVPSPTQERDDAISTRDETRTPVRPSVRNLTRMPFEIYRDQHSALKQFSLEEQARGEKGSMSQMVREALDVYIAKRRRQAR